MPGPLAPLADEIVRTRGILGLPDDFDGDGSPGYADATWLRAAGFLLSNAMQFWQDRGLAVGVPDLGPGPYGSIDLDWRLPKRELLLNVPVDEDGAATFSGDDGEFGHSVKGALDLADDNSWLIL